ncbi:MAG: hypothetical protein GEU99_14630 [Luteitalea sp.]|nr:hypothetical protein [Luteitalea sp.]
MLTQRLLAHLPLLLHPNPKDVAIIGLGSGVTLGSALRHPIEHATILEISPEVVEASRFFEAENHRALADPRTRPARGSRPAVCCASGHTPMTSAPATSCLSSPRFSPSSRTARSGWSATATCFSLDRPNRSHHDCAGSPTIGDVPVSPTISLAWVRTTLSASSRCSSPTAPLWPDG